MSYTSRPASGATQASTASLRQQDSSDLSARLRVASQMKWDSAGTLICSALSKGSNGEVRVDATPHRSQA